MDESMKPIDRLVYWIKEREMIRAKKETKRPAPWTTDPILSTYRFCNVIRMDDKVSKWLLKNWYEPNYGHTNMLIACALARFFNKPETLAAIGFPKTYLPNRIKDVLRERREAGETLFNGAYMVRGNDGVDKVSSVIDFYIKALVDADITVNTSSMQETHAQIVACYGWGSFMAGQVVADLRWALPGDWEDRRRWAPCGPGSMRGLNRLLDLPLKKQWKADEFSSRLFQLRPTILTKIPGTIGRRLELHDLQNCLCEFDKYERARLGEGKPKQLYKAST